MSDDITLSVEDGKLCVTYPSDEEEYSLKELRRLKADQNRICMRENSKLAQIEEWEQHAISNGVTD